MGQPQKRSVTQLLNFTPDSYLERTTRPVYVLVFLLPFIVLYELGTLLINTDLLSQYWTGRVKAFSWLQASLEYLGFRDKFTWVATPLVVVVILIAMQITSRKKWRIWFAGIVLMALESILLAIPLIVLSLVLNSSDTQHYDLGKLQQPQIVTYVCAPQPTSATAQTPQPIPQSAPIKKESLLADLTTSIGAGIYEELVFRLILICLLMLLFQDILRFGHKHSIVLSVLISAALFSVHHHIDFFSGHLDQTDPFTFIKFFFRTVAGAYFALLFVVRGFGIAAGTHAFYDIIAVCINAAFFTK